MSRSFTPSPNALTTPAAPQPVVEAFLDAVADADLDRAAELLFADVAYVNVGLPVVHGRAAVLKKLALMDRPSASFEV